MRQSFWLRLKIKLHVLLRYNHQLKCGMNNGYFIIWCSCGYYFPRINLRGNEKPFDGVKTLTGLEAERLLKVIQASKEEEKERLASDEEFLR